MTHDSAGCWTRLRDDKELRYIDEYGKEARLEWSAMDASLRAMEQKIYTYQGNQHPATEGNICDHRKSVHERDEI